MRQPRLVPRTNGVFVDRKLHQCLLSRTEREAVLVTALLQSPQERIRGSGRGTSRLLLGGGTGASLVADAFARVLQLDVQEAVREELFANRTDHRGMVTVPW